MPGLGEQLDKQMDFAWVICSASAVKVDLAAGEMRDESARSGRFIKGSESILRVNFSSLLLIAGPTRRQSELID